MSPPRRRSSRLAAVAAKARSTPELSSVAENENTNEPSAPPSPAAVEKKASGSRVNTPSTPVDASLKPPREEMHPSKCHSSMAPEPSSALRLGFTDIRPGNMNVPSEAQETPSKPRSVPATDFTFRVSRNAADVPLSENAQRLMNELREHANMIKADMRAQRETEGGDIAERKIAQPKPKASRFSAAHMAEFKKMDSIAGHASVWRANKTPPAKPSLKRTSSKANLDGTPTSAAKPNLKRTLSKANLNSTPQSQAPSTLKRPTSRAKLDDGDGSLPESVNFSVAGKPRTTPADVPQSSFAKRIKKFQDDDTSTARPVSRDGSTIPRPKSSGKGAGTLSHSSSLARLTSPTKASRGHSAAPSKPTVSLVKSPPKPDPGRLAKSPSTASIASSASKSADLRRRIVSPGRFEKVKSILRGQKSETDIARTALPKPAMQGSQTPAPPRTDKELPPLPQTTPRRKLVKHVAFTPDTKRAAETRNSQNSPSPQKSGPAKKMQAVQYPTLDGVLADSTSGDVVYPDLSGLKDLTESQEKRKSLPKSVPGTFTFRSDHTIDFGAASASGFGASPGQASLRHVRTSAVPKGMPGSFPAPPSPSTHPDKENREPQSPKVIPGAPHGMSNKKRHRASSEEEDGRAAKKRKNEHVPEAKTLFTPRAASATPVSSAKKMQTGPTPSRTPGSASPTKKKKAGLSMSRLNMLARPKHRT